MSRSDPASGVHRVVATFAETQAAHLLAGRLRAEGIDALVEDPVSDDPYRGVPAMLGRVKVLVPESRLTEAEEIVRAIERG